MAEKIEFTWDAAANVDHYQLFEDGTLAVDNIVTPSFSLLMANIEQGEHSYQVRGVNQFGEGGLSTAVIVNFILPAKVQNLRFTVI